MASHRPQSRAARQFEAVIFDMDGVLTDSEPLYALAINEVLASAGHVLTEKDHAAIMGSSIEDTWDWIFTRFDLSGERGGWLQAYDHAVTRLLSSRAEASPGLLALLANLQSRGTKIGLASSSRERWVRAVLKRLGIQASFGSIAACEMVAQAKPAPDLYLLAARGLGIGPKACIALEDSPRGIASGKAAGMYTIALRTVPTAGMDISEADEAIDRLEDFPLGLLG